MHLLSRSFTNQLKKIACGFAVVCMCTSAAQAETIEVRVVDFDFLPRHVTVNQGDTVRWVWESSIGHSSTAAAGIEEFWDSPVQTSGFTFEHTFTELGSFPYYCRPHGKDLGNGNTSGMSGSVFVTDDCLTLTLDQLEGGKTTTFTIAGGTAGSRVALVYGLKNGRTALDDFSNFCFSFGILGVKPENQIGGLVKLNPDATIRQFIPANFSGTDVLFQAATQGTCPDKCQSEVLAETIL